LKRGDLIIIGLVLIFAFGGLYMLFFQPAAPPGAEIVIQVDGVDKYKFPLYEEGRGQRLDILGPIGTTTVEMEDGRVRVVHSDCPDQICVSMGWINNSGVPIACLPNRVVVRISGEVGDGDFDLR